MSMQINVLQELRHPLGSESTYELDEASVRLDGSELKDVSGSLKLLRTDRGLLASLNVTATIREKCARCLIDADCPVEMEFEEEFVATVDPNTGTRTRLNEDDEAFRIRPDFTLDLGDAIRQYGLMAEPLKPLCRADCAGLCPTCGANLNEGGCGCVPAADERLSVLAGLDASDEQRS
jgi:uncharacterized protein